MLAPSAFEPATSAPSGQPRPFERQSVTVSKRRPISAAGTPSAVEALKIRAPSRCTASSSSRTTATTASISSRRQTRPPDELCVFSSETSRVRGSWPLRGSVIAARICSGDPPRVARERANEEAGVHRRAALLGDEDVRVLLGDQHVPGLGLDPEGDLVRHRRRRQEDRFLLPEQLRCPALELEHGRVLALLLVADDRVRDRLPHRGRRLGQRPSGARSRSASYPTRLPSPRRRGAPCRARRRTRRPVPSRPAARREASPAAGCPCARGGRAARRRGTRRRRARRTGSRRRRRFPQAHVLGPEARDPVGAAAVQHRRRHERFIAGEPMKPATKTLRGLV